MAGFFQKPKPQGPATVPTDTIIPVHYFDDNTINRSVLLYITLRFDDFLDPERLRGAMDRLMELGDWRKLGARIRMTDQGKLEYHVPAAFDAMRPGFVFSHEKHDTSIQDHPLASRIPRPTSKPSVYSDLGSLVNLARRSDGPKKLDDFLCSDEPQLSLHIVSFTDATLVSVSWLHTFMDAVAMSAVLKAWVSVLDGREADVPPVYNFDKDPLSSLGTTPTESYVLADRQLTGLNMVLFSIRYVFDLICYRDSQRTIYLPPHQLRAMKEAALKDLATQSRTASQDPSMQTVTPSSPFLSDGDVLCSFLTRLAVKNLGPTSTRQIAIMNAFNFRSSLSTSTLPQDAGVCLSNAVFVISAFASACDILTKPLSYTASLVRASIVEQSTPAQIDALAGLTRQAVDSTGRPPVFGDGGTRLVIFSNWTKAGFFELDFGSAMAGGEKIDGRCTKPTFVNLTGESSGLSPRGSWPILGREAGGGYWVQGNLRSDLWEAVEKELESM